MNIGRQIGRNMLPSDSLIVGLYADILIMSKACFGIIKRSNSTAVLPNE